MYFYDSEWNECGQRENRTASGKPARASASTETRLFPGVECIPSVLQRTVRSGSLRFNPAVPEPQSEPHETPNPKRCLPFIPPETPRHLNSTHALHRDSAILIEVGRAEIRPNAHSTSCSQHTTPSCVHWCSIAHPPCTRTRGRSTTGHKQETADTDAQGVCEHKCATR